jgi:hypothetical protein
MHSIREGYCSGKSVTGNMKSKVFLNPAEIGNFFKIAVNPLISLQGK